jgi:hypothetical protein
MSKYYAVVARAITEAGSDAPREATYDQMRALLLTQLSRTESPLNNKEIKLERLALEEAIRTVEREERGIGRSVNHRSTPSTASVKQRPFWSSLLLAAVVIQTMLLAWLFLVPVPTTEELDGDLDQVRNQIKQASMESEKYASGLLKSLIELRRETLQNTQAMLEQKKASLVRRISLDFLINGKELRPATDEELRDISDKIRDAEEKLAQSQKNAARYTGGLVQAMAMMTAETDQLAVSQLRLKYYAAKYGLPAFLPPPDTLTKEPQPAPGTVVKDRDAL